MAIEAARSSRAGTPRRMEAALQAGYLAHCTQEVLERSVYLVAMSDWVKPVIGALAGLLIGIFVEPLKTWLMTYVKERALKKAIYASIADMYGFLSREHRAEYYIGFIDSNLELFEHLYSTDKALFFRIREAPFIKSFYYILKNLAETLNSASPVEQEQKIKALLRTIENGIEFGTFDGERLRKLIAAGPSWRIRQKGAPQRL
jgi:hypothetical protein